MDLKKKRVLITAGPTWVALDGVRVISNIASGETGVLLAKKLLRLGARPTLILGPGQANYLNGKIRLRRFRFFTELRHILTRELKSGHYDMLIHTAAVSDYRPKSAPIKKIDSGKKLWKLNLVPTPKLIELVKKISPEIYLVGFKYKPGAGKTELLKKAKKLLRRCGAGLVVANTRRRGRYQAYVIDGKKIYARASGKEELTDKLIQTLRKIEGR